MQFLVDFMYVMIKLSYVSQVLCNLKHLWQGNISYMNTADPDMTGAQPCLSVTLVIHISDTAPPASVARAPPHSSTQHCMAL